ncbi:uncharacterized protein LOC110454115 [Mizuhopecten yessoensis]|uniref:uncharacterized protein LOC110454115 n=1 Tax=Mizuhopecten yessoensis TaxID=6573 RepID=UPI000B4582D1|nr:uncharacterized protein LOC110454115 [Mizuhopecten yessoensis]
MSLERFTELDESELKKLLDRKDSESTKKTVKAAVAVLQHYLEAKGQNLPDMESASSEECDDLLRKFYVETRKEDGTRYAKKSMVTLRYGLQKHFIRTREQDIINDKTFSRSNEMFKAVLAKLKEDGIGECVQTEPVTPEDMAILYTGSAFNTNTPEGLQRKVMFEYLYYFCSRGRENLRGLKRSDFIVGVDSSGREYVAVRSKPKKNYRGDDILDLDHEQSRMYDKPGDPRCPVAAFKKYVDKLHNENSNFWQRPKKTVNEYDTVWYDNFPVGKNTLYSFMQKLSQDHNLSKRYTNHSVRATSITTLDHNGVEARHIMSVSGHKNENSIRSYIFKLSDDKKRQMSDILSENIAPPSKTARRSMLSMTGPPAPSPPVQTLTRGPALQEQDDMDADRLSAVINEQESCSLGTNASPSSKDVIDKGLTMMNKTEVDRMKERDRIAAILRTAVLSLCQEKYQNPIEVDALICVALTPTDNHVVKIHETLRVFGNEASRETPPQDANGDQNICKVSNTWSIGPKSKRKRKETTEQRVMMTEAEHDLRELQTQENSEDLLGANASESGSEVVTNGTSVRKYRHLSQNLCGEDNMCLSTINKDVLRKGDVESCVKLTQPKNPGFVVSGLIIPVGTALPIQPIPVAESHKVPVAETSIYQIGKLDHGKTHRASMLTQDDNYTYKDYTAMKRQSKDSLYSQKVSKKKDDSSADSDENNSIQTMRETLPGGMVIKEETIWSTTESKWPMENDENSGEVDNSQTSSTCNTPTQFFQPESPEVPLEMSVTSIKEEPQDSDISEPEMEIDIDIDSSQFEHNRKSDSLSISETNKRSILSKILKGKSLKEAYESGVAKDRLSPPNTGEDQDNSLVYRLPFVSFQDLFPGEVSGEKSQERDNVAITSPLETSMRVGAALTPTEHANRKFELLTSSLLEKRNMAKAPYPTRLSSGGKNQVNYSEMANMGADFDVSDNSGSPRSDLSYSPRLQEMLDDNEKKS